MSINACPECGTTRVLREGAFEKCAYCGHVLRRTYVEERRSPEAGSPRPPSLPLSGPAPSASDPRFERSLERIVLPEPLAGYSRAAFAGMCLGSGATLLLVRAILAWSLADSLATPARRPGLAVLRTRGEWLDHLAYLSVAVGAIAALAFFFWLHQACTQLQRLKITPRFTPGQALASFFIPFINLVRPWHVMQELWRGSDPDARQTFRARSMGVTGWWLLSLLCAGLAIAARNAALHVASAAQATRALRLDAMLDFVASGTAIALIVIIVRISRRQDARFDRLIRSPPDEFTHLG